MTTLNRESAFLNESRNGAFGTARWRDNLATNYPADTRNAAAAVLLRQIAARATYIRSDIWRKIEPYFDPGSTRWTTALSKTNRDVGFRTHPTDFEEYLHDLVVNLRKQ